MKKYLQLALIVCLMLVFTALGTSFPAFADEEDTASIRIVHTNDSHGRYAAGEACVGYARLQTIAAGDDWRADLILDAGDAFHGLPFATAEKGASIAELFQTIGYTAMTPGLSDLSYGVAHLRELETDSGTPLLSCNLLDGGTAQPVFKSSVGLTVQGFRVGLIGVTSPDLLKELETQEGQSLILADPAACVQQEIDRLRGEGCTIVVVLAYLGDSSLWPWTSERLVSETEGIDVLIDGRTHTEENRLVSWKNGEGQALCVQTGAYLENVGVLTLEVDRETGRPVNLSTSCEQLISAAQAQEQEMKEDAGVAEQIASIEKRQSVLSASASSSVSSAPASSSVKAEPSSQAVSSTAAVSSEADVSSSQPEPAGQDTSMLFSVLLSAAVVVFVVVLVLLSQRRRIR